MSLRSLEPWQGLDEAVVERFAAEAGRHARGPLIPTDQGDLLLFVFLVLGALSLIFGRRVPA